jgi:hypothetical protein
LSGEYFQAVDNSQNNEVFVNLWRGWNGEGQIQQPATLITFDNSLRWRTVSDESGLPCTWTYIQKHQNIYFAGTSDALFVSVNSGSSWQPNTSNTWMWHETIKCKDAHLFISDFRLEKSYVSQDKVRHLTPSRPSTGLLTRKTKAERHGCGCTRSLAASVANRLSTPTS